MRRRLALSILAYAAAFVPAAFSWLQMAGAAIPAGAPSVAPEDARLHTWILAWVTHALTTEPARLFDANINYPAPMQLAGSEHFLSSQLVFAPVFLATGNAVLATNVLVMISYPLAALGMQQLLIALGCRALPAWIASVAAGGLIGSWLGAARYSILNLRRALAVVLVLAAAKLVFFP